MSEHCAAFSDGKGTYPDHRAPQVMQLRMRRYFDPVTKENLGI